MIDQALNDDVFHVAGNFLFEVHIVAALVGQMRGAHDYVLDGALEAPTHFHGVWTVARVMVLQIGMVLGGVSPLADERFGPLVHAGFVGDLCMADGEMRGCEDKTVMAEKYVNVTGIYRERRKIGRKLQNIREIDRRVVRITSIAATIAVSAVIICGNRNGDFNYSDVVPVSPKRPLTILVFLGTRRGP